MNRQTQSLIEITAYVVAAYLKNNRVAIADLESLLGAVHNELTYLVSKPIDRLAKQKPLDLLESTVTPDYIVCLEDGKKYKSLKRHLSAFVDLTPDQYREKWGLPANYPMVAPNYSAKRSDLAKVSGFTKDNSANRAEAPRSEAGK